MPIRGRGRRFGLALAVVLVYGAMLPLLAAQAARASLPSAHCCVNDGVICIDECRVKLTDNTKYDYQMGNGVSNWNAVAVNFNIAVRVRFGDFGNFGYDVYDYSNCDTNVIGAWNASKGYMRFNKCLMDDPVTTESRRLRVTAHEIGHSLGFEHNDIRPCRSVLRPGVALDADTCWVPGDHDEEDYVRVWRR